MMTVIEKLEPEAQVRDLLLQNPRKLHELELMLTNAAVVSFDFFDTLFVRTVLDPEDVFDILGKRFGIKNFREMRRAAQAKAFRKMHDCGRKEITLEDIYSCLDIRHLANPMEELMRAEYDIELDLIHPNSELIDLFVETVARGKPVALTSDMYLPGEFFKEAFRRHNLPLVPMFISADRNATKRDHGELFDILALELGVANEQVLHIGDNALSDIKQAKIKGLLTYHYLEGRRPPKLDRLSPEASLARGLLRKHVKWVERNSAQELGFLYGGPAAMALLNWLVEQAQRDKIDQILFLARDGYVLNLIASESFNDKLPKFDYFLGSRVAFTLAAINDSNFEEFIPFLLSGAEGLSPHELLERIGVHPPKDEVFEKFGLSANSRINHSFFEQLEEFLYAYRWEILKVCRRNRRALFVYLRKIGVKPGGRIALVDVGWSGTTQDAFEKAIHNLLDIQVHGYYFCLADTPERLRRQKFLRMSALISSETISKEIVAEIYRNRAAVELFFSAPHESVIGLSVAKGGDVEAVEDVARGDSHSLAQISSGIVLGMVKFASDFECLRMQIGMPISSIDLAMPLIEFATKHDWKNHSLVHSVTNFDNWSRTRNKDKKMSEY